MTEEKLPDWDEIELPDEIDWGEFGIDEDEMDFLALEKAATHPEQTRLTNFGIGRQ